MANNYCDMTGVLVLKKVTPVIKALFSCFDLDESTPGNGQVYIARISESSYTDWDAVKESLFDLVQSLSIEVKDDEGEDSEDIEDVLYALATHFKQDSNLELANLIDSHSFQDDADLDTLFFIAQAFDDGHGLEAIKTETAWHCSRPRLFEFGGSGDYIGKNITLSSSSSNALTMGTDIDQALSENDAHKAAQIFLNQIQQGLNSIQSEEQREAVRANLSALAAKSIIQPLTNWDNNSIQFPRLLAEINATQDINLEVIAQSMDLSVDEVGQIFDRANDAWEEVKNPQN